MTFDFYIRFSSHSFNCNVYGLESFIELSFFNWYLIFISNIILILLIVIFSCSYHFLNWNCFSISSFMIWFSFCVKFGSYYFQIYIFSFLSLFSNLFFFSSLSLITLVSWEFYIVIFLGLFFILWSSLMIRVTSSEGWTELVVIIFF